MPVAIRQAAAYVPIGGTGSVSDYLTTLRKQLPGECAAWRARGPFLDGRAIDHAVRVAIRKAKLPVRLLDDDAVSLAVARLEVLGRKDARTAAEANLPLQLALILESLLTEDDFAGPMDVRPEMDEEIAEHFDLPAIAERSEEVLGYFARTYEKAGLPAPSYLAAYRTSFRESNKPEALVTLREADWLELVRRNIGYVESLRRYARRAHSGASREPEEGVRLGQIMLARALPRWPAYWGVAGLYNVIIGQQISGLARALSLSVSPVSEKTVRTLDLPRVYSYVRSCTRPTSEKPHPLAGFALFIAIKTLVEVILVRKKTFMVGASAGGVALLAALALRQIPVPQPTSADFTLPSQGARLALNQFPMLSATLIAGSAAAPDKQRIDQVDLLAFFRSQPGPSLRTWIPNRDFYPAGFQLPVFSSPEACHAGTDPFEQPCIEFPLVQHVVTSGAQPVTLDCRCPAVRVRLRPDNTVRDVLAATECTVQGAVSYLSTPKRATFYDNDIQFDPSDSRCRLHSVRETTFESSQSATRLEIRSPGPLESRNTRGGSPQRVESQDLIMPGTQRWLIDRKIEPRDAAALSAWASALRVRGLRATTERLAGVVVVAVRESHAPAETYLESPFNCEADVSIDSTPPKGHVERICPPANQSMDPKAWPVELIEVSE